MRIHEDERRKLIDWANGSFKSCKVVIAKQRCIVGDHMHLKKDEEFLLLHGVCERAVIGDYIMPDAPYKAPCTFIVKRGEWHSFELRAGSVLIGVASEEYDPGDEVSVDAIE